MEDRGIIELKNFKSLVDNYTREAIAQGIGCDTSLVTKHYNGDRNITLVYAIKYARFFGVSLDCLVGIKKIDKMSVQLKPCPFCGGQAQLKHTKLEKCINSDNGDFCTRWSVYCPTCGIKRDGGLTEYRFTSDETLKIRSLSFDGRTQAIENWNRRIEDE